MMMLMVSYYNRDTNQSMMHRVLVVRYSYSQLLMVVVVVRLVPMSILVIMNPSVRMNHHNHYIHRHRSISHSVQLMQVMLPLMVRHLVLVILLHFAASALVILLSVLLMMSLSSMLPLLRMFDSPRLLLRQLRLRRSIRAIVNCSISPNVIVTMIVPLPMLSRDDVNDEFQYPHATIRMLATEMWMRMNLICVA